MGRRSGGSSIRTADLDFFKYELFFDIDRFMNF